MMRIPPPALAGLVAGLQASALALVNRASPAAAGRRVVIVGGGDTGADCLGTAHWQGAKEIHQSELLPMPPAQRTPFMPWPLYPMILRTESSNEE